MRTHISKNTTTARVDALRPCALNEDGEYNAFAEVEFDPLELHEKAEFIDHLMAEANYAIELARALMNRVSD